MQSKTTRGLRRLLVSTGVIGLVLSVAAPAALAEKPEERMIWVCHGTGSLQNPYEINLVSVNAQGHDGEELDEDGLAALVAEGVENKGDLNRLSPDVLEGLIGEACERDGDGEETGDEEDVVVVIPPVDGDELPPGLGGELPGTGGVTPPNQDGEDPVVVTPPTGGVEDPTPKVEVKPVETENPGATPPAEKPAPVISTVTITRPAPATPAVPASSVAPAAPQTPAAPAAPVQPTVTAAPTAPVQPAPSVVVSATSRGNEVLGSVTTRTPGGTKVPALAATGTSTTVALAALGAVLLLAGFGLQVTARRVQSCAVEA